MNLTPNKMAIFVLGILAVSILIFFVGVDESPASDLDISDSSNMEYYEETNYDHEREISEEDLMVLNTRAQEDYMGSDQCGLCHQDEYETWSQSLHTKKVRPVSDEGVMTGDFETDPVGISTKYTVSVYYDSDNDEYHCVIKNLTGSEIKDWTITWALGSGTWKQRYMVEWGSSTYILPIQYNTATQEWVAYHAGDWDETTGEPTGYDNSWERRCMGCHSTGYSVTKEGNGEWTGTYSELNVGCEACHGPGSDHMALSEEEKKEDPEIVKSTSAMICAQCHVRGASVSNDGKHGYPEGMEAGDDLADYYVLANNVFWGDGNTSVKHHQQYMDWNLSAHSDETPSFARRASCANCHTPEGADALFQGEELEELPEDVTWQVSCQACHESHGSEYEHDLRADEYDLCGTCHTSEGSEPPSTPHHPQGDMLKGTGGDGLIGVNNMGGVPACSDCHMPKTAKSAIKYDISAHTFQIIEPENEYGIPNSCTSSCHNGVGAGNPLTEKQAQHVMDTWQSEIEELIETTETNLALAEAAIQTAAANGATDEMMMEYEALNESAQFNLHFVEADSSHGMHNFEYTRDLLNDANHKALIIIEMAEKNMAPMADAGMSQLVDTGEDVTFDGSASTDLDGTIVDYLWDFGDGATGTTITETHVYVAAGSYIVTLTVTDNLGASDTSIISVFVIDPVDLSDINQKNDEQDTKLDDQQTQIDEGTDNEQVDTNKNDIGDLDDRVAGLKTGLIIGIVVVLLIALGGMYLALTNAKIEMSKQKEEK